LPLVAATTNANDTTAMAALKNAWCVLLPEPCSLYISSC